MDDPSFDEPTPEPEQPQTGFELHVVGNLIELVLRSTPPPSAGEILSALNDAPVDVIHSAAVFEILRAPRSQRVIVGELKVPPDTPWFVRVSPSRMAAYVVPAPPTDDAEPPLVAASDVRPAIAAAGVTNGLLEDAVAAFADGIPLAAPVLVARGQPARQGHPAEVEFTFETNPSIVPEEHENGTIDYRSLMIRRFVEAGTLLARRTPQIDGVGGRDVTGREIPVPPIRDYPLSKHQGKGTEIDGETLVASQAGRPVLTNDRVEVLPFYDVKGDLDFSVGNIDFAGDVIIHGDIHPGFQIHATGAVTIQGIVDRATIVARGAIVARAITGDERSVVQSDGDIAAQYVHSAHVVAGGTLKVQREILHSNVITGRVEMPANGRIVGGHLVAAGEVVAGVLGSVQATATYVEVGAGLEGKKPVIRAAKQVYFGTLITLAHGHFSVDDDFGPSSFWAFEGEVVRLEASSNGPVAKAA